MPIITARRVTTSWVADQIQLRDALAGFDEREPGDAIGFAYTPTSAPWLRRVDHTWSTRDGEPVPSSTFEMRAFTSGAELRWWQTMPTGQGRCAIVSETAREPVAPTPPADFGSHTRSLLLWGTAATVGDGWTKLIDGRIDGELWVPVDVVREGSSVYLEFVEYWAQDEHGNVGVVEQRLTQLTAKERQ